MQVQCKPDTGKPGDRFGTFSSSGNSGHLLSPKQTVKLDLL